MRVLFTLLLLATTLHAANLPPAETTALIKNLQQHRAKYPSLTAEFAEERTTHLLNQPVKSEGTIAFQAPNKFRRELKGNTPSVTVSNGEKLWIYYPKFKQAELYTLGQRAFFDDSIAALTAGLNFQEVEKYYRYEAAKEAPGYRLTLTPRTSGLKRMLKTLTVWVDDDFKIARTEAQLPKGDRVLTSYRDPSPTPIPAGTFEFAPPAGTEITQPLGK
jgi:chaperone LolA